MKLAAKIIWIMGPVAMVAVLGVGTVSFFSTRAILRRTVVSTQDQIARQTMDAIDRQLYERYQDIQTIVGIEEFASALENRSVSLLQRVRRRIGDLAVLTGPWDVLSLCTKSGMVAISSDKKNEGHPLPAMYQTIFDKAIKGYPVYSDFMVSRETGRPTLVFAAPVRREGPLGHPVRGVLIGAFSWPALLEILENLQVHATLISRGGKVIGQNQRFDSEMRALRDFEKNHFVHRALACQNASFLVPAGKGFMTSEALASVASERGYLSYKGQGWRLILNVPTAVAFADARKNAIRFAAVFSLLVVALGTTIPFFIAKFVIKPISLLNKMTSTIIQGQYGIQMSVTSSDELGDLASHFNHMSKVLSETTVSKDFLSSILSNMIDPLFVMTTDGTIQMVNQATLDLLGYSKAELEGQPAHVLFVSAQQWSASVEQETLIMNGSVRNLELEFLKKSGEKVPVLFSSSVMKNHENQPAAIIAVAKDVTERKRLESLIRQSEKMSAIGQLAAGVAHEINNPLGVILGFAQATLHRIAPGHELEMPLKSIEKEAVRCKDLVQDLLTFSRVSKMDREPMDLNSTIDGALSLVTARARVAHVEVLTEFAADLPHLLGNPNQIQQIIVNLANNAFDAMGKEGGILKVKTESLKESTLSWICLSVTDTGSGILPEFLPHVFEPFFTTKRVGKGTGLGLSLIHEIVKKHSGTIDVKSRPGNTEFCIKFPVRITQGSVHLNHA